MKNSLIYVLLLLCLGAFVCSCEGLETNGTGNSAIVGNWVCKADFPGEEISEYFEITKNGLIHDYVLNEGRATFKNGVIHTPTSGYWEIDKSWEYNIRDGVIFIFGVSAGEAKVRNNILILWDEEYERVKQIK